MIDFVDNNPRVREFKKQAKILLRQLKVSKTDITLRACHDLVAQQHGYKHWYEFHKEIKKFYEQKEKKVKQYFLKNPPLGYTNYGYSNELGLHYCLDKSNTFNHTLITGTDRNKINLHLLQQAIHANEHVVYMDGDGQDSSGIIKAAIDAGRQKDLRVISFLHDEKIQSNSLPKNLTGNSAALTEMFISFLDEYDSSGAGMWKGRAISLMSCLMMALTYMRDEEGFTLSFESIREYLMLGNVVKLYQRDFPTHIHNSLKAYLFSLPGYHDGHEKQNDTVSEQHGYLHMQFSMILGRFVDTYCYLFSDQPNLQYSDLLGHNKNLIILFKFPSLEKSIDEMPIISKFVMSMIKSQLKFDIQPKMKMTWLINNCPIPRGFAVVPAQAKVNNISIIFSYCDDSFLNSNKEEAASTAYNCNIKIEMNTDSDYDLEHKEKLYHLKI